MKHKIYAIVGILLVFLFFLGIATGITRAQTDTKAELQNKIDYLYQRKSETATEVLKLQSEYDYNQRCVDIREQMAKQIKSLEELNTQRDAEVALLQAQLDYLTGGAASEKPRDTSSSTTRP